MSNMFEWLRGTVQGYGSLPPPPAPEERRGRGRPKAPLVLADEERAALEELVRGEATIPKVAQRARIVLACATGMTNIAVGGQLGLAPNVVCKWRVRFLLNRVEGLLDRPRQDRAAALKLANYRAAVARAVVGVPRGDLVLDGLVVRVTVGLR